MRENEDDVCVGWSEKVYVISSCGLIVFDSVIGLNDEALALGCAIEPWLV